MTYRKRVTYLILLDSLIVLTAIYVSNFVLLPYRAIFTIPLLISSITLLTSHHIFAYTYKLYKRAWEYASIGELIAIFKAVSFSILVTAVV